MDLPKKTMTHLKCPSMSNERECMGSLCSLYDPDRPCSKPHKIILIENDEGYTLIVKEIDENNEMPVQNNN